MSTTAWIKETGKESNKSKTSAAVSTENFTPLSNLIKSKPIKSVYIEEPTDARNQIEWAEPLDDNTVEGLDTITGSKFDNIKGLVFEKPPKVVQKKVKEDTKSDDAIIKEMANIVVTALVALFMSYNLYFNFTNGSEIVKLEDKFDKLPLKEGSGIINTFNNIMSTSLPAFAHSVVNNNSYFKYRTLFVCLLYFCYRLFQTVVSDAYVFITGLLKQTWSSLFRYLFNFKGKNKVISILFFFFLTKNLYSMFTEQGGHVVSFVIANPFLSALLLFIYVVVIYPITVSLSTFVIYCLVAFYSMLSIIYFYFINDFDPKSPYYGVKSLGELFEAITSHLDVSDTHVIFEKSDNRIENFFKMLWHNFHYSYIIMLFLTIIPSILKLQSVSYKIYAGCITTTILIFFSAMKYYGGFMEIVKTIFKV
jgi:hypothetical protein